ncbi:MULTISPECIES: HAD family hydrolase [Psychrilyobacter]|uniref:HAD family hydrolase n=1 Tax=Psychrilyobacter piezotolerans TaxID=2293438 RepID=A0ABX9KEM4_9FUSO|nr:MULTISPECIES: HAD family hydrolase [Psychrilyobacter]MCS5422528.1 HAD family hydrolase [Psychrilyobacter sp. S5]NDI78732.1 HAD family hydrolase [Psychrilyobacter piezotolerans]RDE59581.1 HAD family hydrolase [Psychrilyobacter sp. S5]REI39995.1 HAD family hydrolase [Psychrilyobacter piezotolerans]
MKYKYILFDLDGTLTDPGVGITKAVQYALKKNNIIEESLSTLEIFIGPPLKDSFMEFYSFDEKMISDSIKYFREYFRKNGIFENEVYSGILDLLGELKNRGCKIAVATSKPTVFANTVLKHFGMMEYFDLIVGSNLDGTLGNKAEIINRAIENLKIKNLKETIMIGDRKYDIIGAEKNNIDSIGVLYGYGSLEELEAANPTYIVDSISQLNELLT